MTRTEQRSGNPVYVKWEQRQFIPGWSLRLLSPQITDCHEHPANKPVLGGPQPQVYPCPLHLLPILQVLGTHKWERILKAEEVPGSYFPLRASGS